MERKYLTEWKRFLAEKYDENVIKEIAVYLTDQAGGKMRMQGTHAGEKSGDRILTINLPTKRRNSQMKRFSEDVTPTFMIDYKEQTIYLTDGVAGSSASSGKPMANPSDNTPQGTRIDFYELGSLNDFKNWVRSTRLGQEKDDYGDLVINLP